MGFSAPGKLKTTKMPHLQPLFIKCVSLCTVNLRVIPNNNNTKKPLAHRKTSEELQIISSATINFEASVAVDASPLVDQFKFKWT